MMAQTPQIAPPANGTPREWCTVLNRTGGQPGSAIVASQMYKTKLCIDNQTKGCTRGDHCPYAHSLQEIKTLPDLKNTKMCMALLSGKGCSKKSCNFAHSEVELRYTCKFSEYKTRLCRFSQAQGGRGCHYGTKCPYAHSLEELRTLESPTIPPTEILLGKNCIQRNHFESTNFSQSPTAPPEKFPNTSQIGASTNFSQIPRSRRRVTRAVTENPVVNISNEQLANHVKMMDRQAIGDPSFSHQPMKVVEPSSVGPAQELDRELDFWDLDAFRNALLDDSLDQCISTPEDKEMLSVLRATLLGFNTESSVRSNSCKMPILPPGLDKSNHTSNRINSSFPF